MTDIPPLCSFNCGQIARFFSKAGIGRCANSAGACPEIVKQGIEIRKRNSLARYGNISSTEIRIQQRREAKERRDAFGVIPEGQLCEYGCGQPAIFKKVRGDGLIYRCSRYYLSCPKAAHWTPEQRLAYKVKTGVDHPLKRTDKIRQTKLAKYGVDHHMKVPEIMDKKKATCLSLYGATQGFSEEQHQANVTAKYGVDNVFQLPEVITRLKSTNRDRYGADYSCQSKEVMKSRKLKWKETLGFEHPLCKGAAGNLKTEETRSSRHGWNSLEKYQSTCREHWGAPHHFQSSEWFNSFKANSLYKRKDFTLPSGKSIKLQGYEPWVLTDLLEKGFSEQDFLETKICFSYIDPITGKPRVYHPDFVLTDKVVIEVKSRYLMETDNPVIMAKARTVLDEGYRFIFAIGDPKGNLEYRELENEP
jgi:hypothetical protein